MHQNPDRKNNIKYIFKRRMKYIPLNDMNIFQMARVGIGRMNPVSKIHPDDNPAVPGRPIRISSVSASGIENNFSLDFFRRQKRFSIKDLFLSLNIKLG